MVEGSGGSRFQKMLSYSSIRRDSSILGRKRCLSACGIACAQACCYAAHRMRCCLSVCSDACGAVCGSLIAESTSSPFLLLSLSRSLSRTQLILVTVVIGTFVLLLLQRGCNKAATETVHKYKSLAATREGEQCSPSRARTLLQRLLHSFCCTLSTLCQVHPSAL